MINYESFRAEASALHPQVVSMYKVLVNVVHRGDTSIKGLRFHALYNQLVQKYS